MNWRFWRRTEDATYVRDIQILAPEHPLALPPIRPLMARKAKRLKRRKVITLERKRG